jgi:hypothetical protein
MAPPPLTKYPFGEGNLHQVVVGAVDGEDGYCRPEMEAYFVDKDGKKLEKQGGGCMRYTNQFSFIITDPGDMTDELRRKMVQILDRHQPKVKRYDLMFQEDEDVS